MDGFNRPKFCQSLWVSKWVITLLFFKEETRRTACICFHHWWIFSLKLTAFSLDHFLHQHIIYLKESFLFQRIVLKIMDIPEGVKYCALFDFYRLTNSDTFHSSLDFSFLPLSPFLSSLLNVVSNYLNLQRTCSFKTELSQ